MHQAAELFARQHGVATARQLERAGVSRAVLRHRLSTGEWERLGAGVIRMVGTRRAWRGDVVAAWLAAGPTSAVSHITAARWHGFDGCGRELELHVTTHDGTHRSTIPGAVVHRSALLRPTDCLLVDGVSCVSKPVALLQLAAARGRDRAAQALDGLLRDGASPLWIGSIAQRWRRQRVSGPAAVLGLLHERVDGRLPRSWFQRLAKRVLGVTGLRLVDEHPVVDPSSGRCVAELDLALPELRIGVECQSWSWHATPAARTADAARKRRLRLLGWEIVELWWTDLRRIDDVVTEIRFLVNDRSGRLTP